jgi:hypothetical protein
MLKLFLQDLFLISFPISPTIWSHLEKSFSDFCFRRRRCLISICSWIFFRMSEVFWISFALSSLSVFFLLLSLQLSISLRDVALDLPLTNS